MQLAQAFSSLVNGGNLIKPTIIEQIYDQEKQTFIPNDPIILRRVFKEETANEIKEALFEAVEGNPETKGQVHLE
ncbi:MAG: hypothetical protein H6766_02285 [Candidatus Peribacteria bacterium]|nr:MAG: hypothetical protein H6766_02285 [Candidatus Peribacteria bacterium]